MTPATQVVDIEGVPVRLTTLERVLWPAVGFTKADMIDFYVAVAPVLLPHVRGRPLTLHRFPEGVDGPSFFQTRAPSHPPWVRVQRMSTFTSGKEVDAVVLDDLAGLVWAANLSAIELHPYLGCAEDLVHPTQVVFDLDPGPPATLVDACRVALLVRSVLEDLGLSSLPKVSGGVGIHVVVPIAPRYPYDETKAFARAVAAVLVRHHPDLVTDRMPRRYRAGRVFIDWSQNDAGKSTVAPYSLRGGVVPTVAMPVEWTAVERTVATRDHVPLVFAPDRARREIDEHGDRHAAALASSQSLPTPVAR